jgi:hypothetical protein
MKIREWVLVFAVFYHVMRAEKGDVVGVPEARQVTLCFCHRVVASADIGHPPDRVQHDQLGCRLIHHPFIHGGQAALIQPVPSFSHVMKVM